MLILPLDTETTGIPLWREPSDDPRQPHLVDICAMLFNEHGVLIDSFEALVRPDGWVIPPDVTAIHGVTHEMAMDLGIPERDALEGFMALHARSDLRVAHSVSFDDRIMRIAISRYMGKEAADAFKAHPTYCTAAHSRPVLNLPPVGAQAAKTSFKTRVPTVAEALFHFTGEELVNAHRARPDAEACAKVYFAMNPPAQVA